MSDIEWPTELRTELMWLVETIGAERLKKASAFIRNSDNNGCQDAAPDAVEYVRADLVLALVAEACEAASLVPMERLARGDSTAPVNIGAAIQRLTPADAIAARDARDKQVREQALREAADKARRTVECCQSCASVELQILAMIEKDKTNE